MPYWAPFALSVAAMVVTALTEPAFPALLKPLLDAVSCTRKAGCSSGCPALIVAVFLVRRIRLVPLRLRDRLGGEQGRDGSAQRDVLQSCALPTNYYDNHTGGSLISKFTSTSCR